MTLLIEIPDGAQVTVDTTGPALSTEPSDAAASVERYWRDYLSDNGRNFYGAVAAVEGSNGPGFTLNQVADEMGVSHSSALSIHRTTGRPAKRWRADTGTEAPIHLIDLEYTWFPEHNGMRTTYRLPDGIAEAIRQF